MQKPRPLSSHPAAYYNYLRLPAVYSAWSQTRNYPDPGSHCLGLSWDSTGPPLGPRPCPRSRTHTWGVARMRVDTTRVKAGSCPARSRRCCRSTRCCPQNIYTQEARQDSPADTLEEEWMASALKWIIKDSCEEWYWNMVILELKTWFRQRVMHTTVHCRTESISFFSHSTIVGWNPVWGYCYFRFGEIIVKYFKVKNKTNIVKYLVKLQRHKSIV